MFKQIDWLQIKGYFKSYAICLISLLSLYIVVDLFMHLDDFFSNGAHGLGDVTRRVTAYYGYRVPQFFDRLCEAIVLLAAMFTVALMQRNNEHLPMLSAGVPTQRIVAPVLFCAFFMVTLSVLNQELLIPRIGDKLSFGRDDPDGKREMLVRSCYEPNGIQFEGERARRKDNTIYNLRCMIPETVAGDMIHLCAQEAHYRAGPEPQRGTWLLIGCRQPGDDKRLDDKRLPQVKPIPGILEVQDNGRYLLHTRNVDFDALTRDPKWFQMAPTYRLYQELQRPESNRLAAIAVLFHTRLTRPLLGMVLVLMGLSVILRDTNRNVIISSGLCVILCGVFFVTCHACKMLGDYEYLSPALAAWLPVIGFGPFSVVMFDAVQT
jgi:lipopolysaccharide export system permease protein